MLTIIFSGPVRTAGQTQNALSRAGFPVLDGDAGSSPHGLADMVDGVEPSEPQAFLAVVGDDVDGANETAVSYGWTLRMHRVMSPSTAEQSKAVEWMQRLELLERRLHALEGSHGG